MANGTFHPYGSGTRVELRNGELVVVGPDGNVIPGAVPTNQFGKLGYTAPDNLRPVEGITDLPAGSYDPSLIYQGQNANLGQLYNTQDFQTAFAGYDPEHAPQDLSTAGTTVQDYWNQRSALSQALERARQDYGQSTETLGRNYQQLGNQQLQSANAAGLLGGGALAQAFAKRTANQGRDQAGLDQSMSRYSQDNATATNDLTTGFRRAYATGQTTLGRGAESNALYQGGLFATAAAQAGQSGMLADNPNYQTHNGVIYQVMPDGSRTPVAKAGQTTTAKKPPRAPAFRWGGPNTIGAINARGWGWNG